MGWDEVKALITEQLGDLEDCHVIVYANYIKGQKAKDMSLAA